MIFISYSSADRPIAERLHEHLQAGGFEVWRDRTRLEVDWSREIAEALAACDDVCILWSPGAAASRWVTHEWSTARALEKRILICQLPNAPPLPPPLRTLDAIPFDIVEAGCAALRDRLENAAGAHARYDFTIRPRNSYVPFNPNPHFSGRQRELLELYLAVIGHLDKIGVNHVGVVGMGGVGKTQLVVEFACRFAFSFSHVFWIQGGDPARWPEEYVSLARDRLQLAIPGTGTPEAEKQYLYALQQYMRDHAPVLIVIDNVDDAAKLNDASLPGGLAPLTVGSDMLFTTRRQFEIPGVRSLPLQVLDGEGAYQLLRSYRVPETTPAECYARAICGAVGHLPLAITLAGAFLRESGEEVSFGDYHDELVQNALEVIDIGGLSPEQLATRHEAAVRVTLQSQWDTIGDELAGKILLLAAHFPEGEIVPTGRLALFAGAPPAKAKLRNPLTMAFRRLEQLSLMESLRDPGPAVRLHPLVREFAARLVNDGERARLLTEACERVQAVYFDFDRLRLELDTRGLQQVIGDLAAATRWCPRDAAAYEALHLLHDAMRLSMPALSSDLHHLRSQLCGRLQRFEAQEIRRLLARMQQSPGQGWLRPILTGLEQPGGLLQYSLRGHTGTISKLVVSSIGSAAASAGLGEVTNDEVIIFWDLDRGELSRVLPKTPDIVDFSVTPGGREIIFSLHGDNMTIRDVRRDQVLAVVPGATSRNVVFAPVEQSAAAVATRTGVEVRDLEGGEIIGRLPAMETLDAIAVLRDRRVVTISKDAIRQWDPTDGRLLRDRDTGGATVCLAARAPLACLVRGRRIEVLDLERWDTVTAVTLDRDASVVDATAGRLVALAGENLDVWDLPSGEKRHGLPIGSDFGQTAAISPDGRLAISISAWSSLYEADRKLLKVWDLDDGSEIGHLPLDAPIRMVRFSNDGRRVVSDSHSGRLRVFRLDGGPRRQTLPGHPTQVTQVWIGGTTAASGAIDGGISFWDVTTGTEILSVKGGSRLFFDYHRTGRIVLTADGRYACWVYEHQLADVDATHRYVNWADLRTGGRGCLSSGLTKDAFANSFAVSAAAAENRVLCVDCDNVLKVWSLETGEEVCRIDGDMFRTTALTLSADGRYAVRRQADGVIVVKDLRLDVETATDAAAGMRVAALVAGTRSVLAVCNDGTAVAWPLPGFDQQVRLTEPDEKLRVVVADPGGRLMAYVQAKESLERRPLDDDIGVCTEMGFVLYSDVAITADGRYLAQIRDDGTLSVWDTVARAWAAHYAGESRVTACAISPDGCVVAGELSGRMHFLKLEPGVEP